MELNDILAKYERDLAELQAFITQRAGFATIIQAGIDSLDNPRFLSRSWWKMRRYRMLLWEVTPINLCEDRFQEFTGIVEGLKDGNMEPAIREVQREMKRLKEGQKYSALDNREKLFKLDKIQKVLLANARKQYNTISPVDLLSEKTLKKFQQMIMWGQVLALIGLYSGMVGLVILGTHPNWDLGLSIFCLILIPIVLGIIGMCLLDYENRIPPEQIRKERNQ